ncbi:phosphoribosyltransferase family protein [Marinigracilibium pacificum]|uniref:Phosphoribosyltransferase n=1 Tax=Marinigracilibium pacificum TaxID=2729599 RepID=A0A848J540_9BACT|nr:phosphoribosyltransferase family protein [Marinigracilibium pacificum]NMM49630.1 phosphoribosyltransferase [Marinigracilibium pacificum]
MTSVENKILDAKAVHQKIIRMAYEIYERNFEESNLIMAGIEGAGVDLAHALAKEVKKISKIEVEVVEVLIDKSNPDEVKLSDETPVSNISDSVVILVDDVLNTGRTMANSMKIFLGTSVKKIETAVLVNRSHKSFPVLANYLGYELSTTLNDHIKVVLGEEPAVYLK